MRILVILAGILIAAAAGEFYLRGIQIRIPEDGTFGACVFLVAMAGVVIVAGSIFVGDAEVDDGGPVIDEDVIEEREI